LIIAFKTEKVIVPFVTLYKVVSSVSKEIIIPQSAGQGVMTGSAVHIRIVAGPTGNYIVTLIAVEQNVISIATVDDVVSGAAENSVAA